MVSILTGRGTFERIIWPVHEYKADGGFNFVQVYLDSLI